MNGSGLAPQRTRLSWRRTLLALTVVALLSARQATLDGMTAGGLLIAAAAMLLWLGALVVTYRRSRALAGPGPPPARRALPLSAATSIGYAVLGAILVLTHLPG